MLVAIRAGARAVVASRLPGRNSCVQKRERALKGAQVRSARIPAYSWTKHRQRAHEHNRIRLSLRTAH
eukprot:1347567-Pleurochrysis_carterae.AAC.1